MKLLIVFVVLLCSCSKKESVLSENSTVEISTLSLTDYIAVDDNPEEPPYYSKIISTIESSGVNDEYLFYSYGLLNRYDLRPDGSSRLGNHPEPSYIAAYVIYKIEYLENNNVRLSYSSSSCDDNRDPFDGIFTTGVNLIYEYTGESIRTSLSNGIQVEFNKDKDFEYSKLRDLRQWSKCEGEI